MPKRFTLIAAGLFCISPLIAGPVAGVLPVGSKASLTDKAARPYVLADKDRYVWGSSVVKGEDGKYHLYYDRWARDNPRGMYGWLYDTEIAHAVSDRPEGPYATTGVVVASRNGDDPKRWDYMNAHNAMIARMKGPDGVTRYYLYFISNHDTGLTKNDWLNHAYGQRIAVAVSDKPEGPFVRSPVPACEPNGIGTLYTVNPGVTRLPDGRYLMVLKSRVAGKPKPDGEPNPGPMIHCWATSDKPEGPFKIQAKPLFPPSLSAEDPCVWVSGGKVSAAVKDWHGRLSGKPGIARVDGVVGADGDIAWTVPPDALISSRVLRWSDGTATPVHALERPYVLCDETGRPTHLFAACCVGNEFAGSSQKGRKPGQPPAPPEALPFNVCIPLGD